MKHEILSWAFGFATPVVVAAMIVGLIGGISAWFSIPDKVQWISIEQAWCGGLLLVGLCIIGGVAAFRFI